MAELQKSSPGSHLDMVDGDSRMWRAGTEKSAAVWLGGDCLQLFAAVKTGWLLPGSQNSLMKFLSSFPRNYYFLGILFL